jgi:hypothetical protein
MSAADQLRYNTSVLAPMVLNGPSLFESNQWTRCANYIDRRIDLTPVEADNYGNIASNLGWSATTLTFLPPKIADRMGETQFMGRVTGIEPVSAGTTGGSTPATYYAAVDGFGFYVFTESRVVNGQNNLQLFNSADAYEEYAGMYNTEERDAIAYLTKSEMSLVERQALVGTGISFDFCTDMPYYWTYTLDRNIALFQQALEDRITISLNSLINLIETDYPADSTWKGQIAQLRLRVLYTHTQAAERDHLTTQVRTDMGLVWKIKDIQRHSISVAANTAVKTLYPLDPITGDVTTLCLMHRLNTDFDGSTRRNRPFNNLQEIPKLRVVSGGGDEIFPWHESDYMLYHVHRKMGYPSPPGKRIYRINFERYPAAGPNAFTGVRYFGNINKPQLEIDWTVAASPSTNSTIYVKAYIVNFMQHSNGEKTRVIPNN